MGIAGAPARTFTASDQLAFGALSGDTNPLHADPVAARRTQAGAWVVHGAHALLWALERIFAEAPLAAMAPSSLKVRFERFIYIGDRAVVEVSAREASVLRAEVRVAGIRALGITLGFGEQRGARPRPEGGPLRIGAEARPPLENALEDLAALGGSLAFARPLAEVAAAFPRTAAVLGASRVAALAALSRLSGMVCPGLHSITSSYSLDFVAGTNDASSIRFATTRVAARFRLATIAVWGAGLEGTIDSFARRPPTEQAAYAAICGRVAPDAFAGSNVLVVGGSRGLGEVTAKIAAAGGAATTLSYAVGREDAERVAAEIKAGAGACRIVRFDVRAPVAAQLRDLTPTHAYYFATPRILRQQAGNFVPEVLADFMRFYADGFYELCRALGGRGPLRVFYPSTGLIEDPPRDALEYVMAKAAGEVLCAGIERAIPGVRVDARRLPPMPTDQTVGVKAFLGTDPVDVMLPVVRALQAAAAP